MTVARLTQEQKEQIVKKIYFIFQLLFVSLCMIIPVKAENSNYTILGYSHTNKYYIKYFDAVCVCGIQKKLTLQEVKKNKSCGCMNDYSHFNKHSLSKSLEYKTWQGIKERCYNVNCPSYLKYGGRGISVCAEWVNSFENFIKDVGFKPSKYHTLDRIDNNGNYEPSNCRWATKKEQANNRSSNYLLTFNGVTKTRSEWAEEIGVNVRTIASRCRANKPIEEILK
jgi:hypothetical protein